MKLRKKIKIKKIIPKAEEKIYFTPKNCKWCKEEFEPINPNHQYCSKICKEEANRIKNNKRVSNHRKKYPEKNKGLGTGNLGEHRLESEKEEIKKIKYELHRLGLKKSINNKKELKY